jgi:hypothetical protein
MHDPLTVAWTVAFEDIEDGWVMARVLSRISARAAGSLRTARVSSRLCGRIAK